MQTTVTTTASAGEEAGARSTPLTLPARIDALIAERQDWEANELARSNARLYQLLAECARLAAEISADRTKQKELRELLETRKVVLKSGVPVTTQVIKLVFGAERRRASAYSLALRAAKDRGIPPADLAAWLSKEGGVEEIRLRVAKPGEETARERRQKLQDQGEQSLQAMTPFLSFEKRAETPAQAGPVLIMAVVNSDYSTDLLHFVTRETLINEALALLGKQTAGAAPAAGEADERRRALDEAVRSVADDGDDLQAA